MKHIIKDKRDLIAFLEELRQGDIETFALYNENGVRYIFDFSASVARVVAQDDGNEQSNPYYIPKQQEAASEEFASEDQWIKPTQETEEDAAQQSEENVQADSQETEQESIEESAEDEGVSEESTLEEGADATQEEDDFLLIDTPQQFAQEEYTEQEYTEEECAEEADTQDTTEEVLTQEQTEQLELLQEELNAANLKIDSYAQELELCKEQNKQLEEKLFMSALGNLSTEQLVQELRARGYVITLQA